MTNKPCANCGKPEAEHAHSDNAYCPKGRCPGATWRIAKSDLWPQAQRKMLAYWNERRTSYAVE